ncbi:MAG: hypothetical protein FWD29_06565 [Micrococcales bacterium]|nr:hypothetical protein [Micrococcales bacterium]
MAGMSARPDVQPGAGYRRRPGFVLVLVLVAALAVVGVFWTLNLGEPRGQGSFRAICTAVSDVGSASLEPDQAENAALISAVGQARGMGPRAVTIGLATAMQESKLRNLTYGDRDSLGLFQQRPSQGWGSREEVLNPIYASNRFFMALSHVAGYEDMAVTEAAQAVQRSGFPEAYAGHEAAARSWASALSGHSPAALTCELWQATAPGSATELAQVHWDEWQSENAQVVENTVTVTVADQTAAWAQAQWAVAKAARLGVESVELVDQRWDRSTALWQPTEAPPLPNGQVVITMAT